MFSKVNTQTLILVPMAVAINMALGQVASSLQLPIFLDSLGTILTAILGGPLLAMITGGLTNLMWGLLGAPTVIFFTPVAMMIGLTAGLLAQRGGFRNPVRAAISGVLISIALAFIAVPIRTYVFGGVTGSGIDFLTGYLMMTGRELFSAVLVSVITGNIADKVISAVVVSLIIQRLPERLICSFSGYTLLKPNA
ncbi:hypothetical protein NX722_06485 [Endozoicomonas gorgoniicola]|uniref:ECF transporter S component n=1 Tax=Endozoicomonas gorgoniicola TaxID=1234144 RepID=A0ABT3MSF8_9GAMM|nr:hypothetical protein [Endozoicomonas gorgoniicola]MCW7552301.1 hypothetical protein [Endozoicomonas gorgoniicola]